MGSNTCSYLYLNFTYLINLSTNVIFRICIYVLIFYRGMYLFLYLIPVFDVFDEIYFKYILFVKETAYAEKNSTLIFVLLFLSSVSR